MDWTVFLTANQNQVVVRRNLVKEETFLGVRALGWKERLRP